MAGESSGHADWMLAGLAPGTTVAGYRIESRVGIGGMAAVFRARDESLDRVVALKVLAPALAEDEGFRERFIRESKAATKVDHPHIIPIFAAGGNGGVLYIAMRYVAGGDLRSVVRREGQLPGERAAFLLSPVASALDAAHAAGLVHRDVKPANILVDASPNRPDHPYLSDFGLAKGSASETGLTGTGQFLGTPDYTAPEQISGTGVGFQADQYALACVAFTILSGSLPFAREDPMAVLFAHLYDPPPRVSTLRPDLPMAVDQVLARALAKAPQDRFASCGEFTEALRAALRVPSYYGVPAGPAAGRADGRAAASAPTWDGPPSGWFTAPPATSLSTSSLPSFPPAAQLSPGRPMPSPAHPVTAAPDDLPTTSMTQAAELTTALPGRADAPAARATRSAGRRKRRRLVITSVIAVLVLACGGGAYGLWSHVRGAAGYYVGERDGFVAIFYSERSQSGQTRTSLISQSAVLVSQLGTSGQHAVAQTIAEGSLASAQAAVSNLQTTANACNQRWLTVVMWELDPTSPAPPTPSPAQCGPASAFGLSVNSGLSGDQERRAACGPGLCYLSMPYWSA